MKQRGRYLRAVLRGGLIGVCIRLIVRHFESRKSQQSQRFDMLNRIGE